jgi:flagella basal body P-ring formation protein FlgA
MVKIALIFALIGLPALAESLTATRIIRAQTILTQDDLALIAVEVPRALRFVDEAIGLETRVTLYPGRPIRLDDLGPPALIDRNQVVTLIYSVGGVGITTAGRALARGGLGDLIRVMNLSSRTVLAGRVGHDSAVYVGPIP